MNDSVTNLETQTKMYADIQRERPGKSLCFTVRTGRRQHHNF